MRCLPFTALSWIVWKRRDEGSVASFDAIVLKVKNSYRLHEVRGPISADGKIKGGNVVLFQFGAVMLASLRSLVPKVRNGDHEVALNWEWGNVERTLAGQMENHI